MRKVLSSVILLLFISCKTTSLEYYFPMEYSTLSKVAEEIKKVKSINSDVFLMFSVEGDFFVLKIIPSDNLRNEKIGSLKVINSNRFVEIEGCKYYIVNRADTWFGIVSKEYITHPATGKKVLAYNCLTKIYDGTNTLYFDREWNFVKKSSLINYDNVSKNK